MESGVTPTGGPRHFYKTDNKLQLSTATRQIQPSSSLVCPKAPSVLGPLLFLYYIWTTSTKGYDQQSTDDTIAYLTVASHSDSQILQSGLELLSYWETTWKMEFHPVRYSPLQEENDLLPTTTNCTSSPSNLYHKQSISAALLTNLKTGVNISESS